ncbi:hypothetical protein C2S53_004063 [Perilla frutescens var. hirtella]|uniref:Uncharacterized protein n=1 Tax=Perilla frutescens var. hirtella TaxID=608512 RepID=A0AAD4P2W7_PERFH|nr:hypothetical protein C2S53_004063 [Perilla frutescens var. hirtella]
MASSLITTNHRIAAAFLLPSPHSHLRLSISKPNSLPSPETLQIQNLHLRFRSANKPGAFALRSRPRILRSSEGCPDGVAEHAVHGGGGGDGKVAGFVQWGIALIRLLFSQLLIFLKNF